MRDNAGNRKVLGIDPRDLHGRLYADFVAGELRDLGGRRALFGDPGVWEAHAARKLSECRATREMWREIEDYNRRLGAADRAVENVESLAGGATVAVTAGQQPGLLGGPLLVMYKAATAVAMAERFTERTGVRCAPVFIVSSDDSDFDEIRRCTLFDRALRRLSLEYPADAYKAGQMVGSLSAETEKELVGSLAKLVGGGEGAPDRESPGAEGGVRATGDPGRASAFVGEVLRAAAGAARDHGDFVAATLSALFSERGLVLIDGRSAEMRVAGAGLFGSYLERRAELRDLAEAAGDEMIRRGYHAQISGASLESWLFLTEGNVRRKIAGGAAEEIRSALESTPEALSPNVALRPLWRDSVLPAIFCVCGPGEVAYSLQIEGAYKVLGVTQPGLLPRLGVTLLPPEAVEVAGGWTEERLSSLHRDIDGTLKSHYRGLIPAETLAALERARSVVAGGLGDLAGSLEEVSKEWRKAAESLRRSCNRGLERLENDIVDTVKRDAQGRNPRLKGLGEFLLPDGKLQERVLSGLAPFLEEGESFTESVISVARAHVSSCGRGEIRHYCYLMERMSDA